MKKELMPIIKERYFIESLPQTYEVEQIIKKETKNNIFQVVIEKGEYIKRFTWFLLKQDINFTRKSLGSGITIFFVDKTVHYFIAKK
ncbi:MAG: hypothetical protein P9L97_05745 [Candidatus Tenebribacter davisii]|nr:hypothetical protein [Candidatus Tenebribacter davisii]